MRLKIDNNLSDQKKELNFTLNALFMKGLLMPLTNPNENPSQYELPVMPL